MIYDFSNWIAESCHPFGGGFLEALGRQPKGTAQYTAFEKTNKREPCFLMNWVAKPLEFVKLKKDFFLFNVRGFMPLLKYFNLAYQKDIFISPPFFTRPFVYYLSKRSKRMNRLVRRMFDHYVSIVFENGFAEKSLVDVQQIIDENYPSFKSTFYTIFEYVDHYTHQIEAITMDDFR